MNQAVLGRLGTTNIFSKATLLVRLQKIFFLAYVFLMPLENVLPASLGGSFIKYIGIVIIALNLLTVLQRGKIYYRKGLFAVLLFCLYILISFIWAKNGINSAYFTIILNMLLFTITSSQMEVDSAFFRTIFKVLLLSGVIVSLMVVLGMGLSSSSETYYGETRRTLSIGGSNVDNNNLATMMCLQVVAGFFLFLRTPKKGSKIIYLFLSALIIIAIFYTGSRGSLVGLALSFVILFLVSRTHHKIIKLVVASMIIIAIFYLLVLVLPSSVTQRFSIESVLETGGSGRFEIWADAFILFKEAPLLNKLFGFGWSSFPYIMKSSFHWFVAAHNDYIEVLVELGVLGFALYVVMLLTFFNIARKKDICLVPLLAIILFSSVSMELLVKKMLWMVLLFILMYRKSLSTNNLNHVPDVK